MRDFKVRQVLFSLCWVAKGTMDFVVHRGYHYNNKNARILYRLFDGVKRERRK